MTTPGIIEQLDRCLAFENELIATVGEEFYMWIAKRAAHPAPSEPIADWSQLPPDLIRHCEQEALEAVASDTEGLVRAVLRASGYAELVAALEKARDELESWYDAKNVLATINAALAAAGHTQGSGK